MRNRTLLAIMCLSLAAALPLQAQGSVGLIGGLSSATIAFDPAVTPSPSSRTGFAAGVYDIGRLGHGVGLEGDLMYVQKGFKDVGPTYTLNHQTGYVELPLMLRVSSEGKSLHIFGVAGPDVAMRTSCSSTLTPSSTTESNTCTNTDGSEDVKRFDGGVIFGAGVGMRRGSVNVRYDLGLTNVENSTGSTRTGKHRTLLVLLAVGL